MNVDIQYERKLFVTYEQLNKPVFLFLIAISFIPDYV